MPKPIDSSLSYREAFLPPGVPSVALRYDETAMLWNPAGLALSTAYYLGYAWKGTYLDGKRQVATHFLLVKSKGFGLGFMRDDYSEGTKITSLFTLAPHVTRTSAVGFTGKWKGGFNFDCGAIYRFRDRVSVGVVGRNLRDRPNVRRYIEGGLAVTAVPRRLNVFFDVINEESPWRDALGYGGGLTARLEHGVSTSLSYFTDGSDHGTVRASLSFISGVNLIEGEYSSSSDDWTTLAGRIASVGR
ncbi:MAG: hypothetical protein WAW06_07280 [bacterium]